MDAPERSALVRATGAAVARVTRTAGDTHTAILGVVQDALAPFGPAVQLPVAATGLVARANYATVSAAARATAAVGAPVVASRTPPDALPASTQPGSVAWLAALSAAFGDRMATDEAVATLTVPMALRHEGALVGLDTLGGLPEARERLVVFVHGLGSHESMWSREYLAAVGSCRATPMAVRYTTGQAIAVSGAELDLLLEEVVARWPVLVRGIVLVGHSMGGLVIREALAGEGSWRGLVTDVVTLGTPHAGAPLERAARRMLAVAGARPITAPLAALGDERSAGIKDLAFGDVATPGPGAAWHLVAGSLGGRAVAGRLGDGMVSLSSAFAVPDEVTAQRVHLQGADHMALLDHGEVVDVIRGVLGSC
jgi:pimeloyl-ACP methyl ester carboxylesterase